MNKLIKILPLLATGVAFVGCRDYDLGYTSEEIAYMKNLKEFAQNFEQAIGGKISPDQDWNMAVQITANYDLTDLPEGKYNIRIFSENPINENAMLLANYNVNSAEAGSIKFDAIKGSSQVYVYILSENKQVVDSRTLKLTSNEVELLTTKELQSRAATRAIGDPVTIGEKIDGTTKIYLNNDYIYPINNLAQGTVTGLTIGAVKDMFVGDDAVFKEEGANGLKYPDLIRDVTFTMKEDGEFKMNLVWAITSNPDAFGYYYKDEVGNYHIYQIFDNILNEFKAGTSGPASGADEGYKNWADDAVITSTIYKLAYVNSTGSISSIFPQGTTIGFFIVQGAYGYSAAYQDYNVLYSQKKLNWKVGTTAGGAHNLQSTWSAYYKYNNKLYLGFEDWKAVRDNDYNDIVFYIDAPVQEQEDASLDVTPETLTESLYTEKKAAIWSIAFEDLGNTLDFDFNDVVLQFKHVAGEDNVDVILAAAGGTLPATLQKDGSNIGQEVHTAFGVETNVPVNVNAAGGKTKSAIENFASVTVDGSTFSITDLSAFSLHVVYSGGDDDEETAANLPFGEAYTKGEDATRAPQCLIIPGRWVWPNENKQVYEAYKDFKTWATDFTKGTPWSGVTEDKIMANWHKQNYETDLLSANPATYYKEEVSMGTSGSEKVEVDAGLVTYHVELNRIGSAKYYGGTLNIKITDWKTDFSTADGYNKVVLEGIQSGNTFTLNIPTSTTVSEFASTTQDGIQYKVTITGSDETKVVDIVVDLSSEAAIKLLGNYGTAESTNTNNNKFDVSAYASTFSAWIVSNNKPNDYEGELPEIDGDDQHLYPDDYVVTLPEDAIDLTPYISTKLIPNSVFAGHNCPVTITLASATNIKFAAYQNTWWPTYIAETTVNYETKSFTLSATQVKAIAASGAGLTLNFEVGQNNSVLTRAFYLTYGDEEQGGDSGTGGGDGSGSSSDNQAKSLTVGTAVSNSYPLSVSEIIEKLGDLEDDDIISLSFSLDAAGNISGISASNSSDNSSSTSICGNDYSYSSAYTKDISYSSIKGYSYVFINTFGNSVTSASVIKK